MESKSDFNSKLIKRFEEFKKKPKKKSRRKAFFRAFNDACSEIKKYPSLELYDWVLELFPISKFDGMFEMLVLILKSVDIEKEKDRVCLPDMCSLLSCLAASSIDNRLKMIERGFLETIVLFTKATRKKWNTFPKSFFKLFTGKHSKRRIKETSYYEDFCELLESASNRYEENIKTIKDRNPSISCRECGKLESVGEEMMKCGRCKLAFYCSKRCQRKNWKTHKLHCKKKENPKAMK